MNEDKVEYVFDQHKSQPPQVISMIQERYDKAIAEARAAEREACYRDVCWMCGKEGWKVEKHHFGDNYIHIHPKMGRTYDCLASAIRQRWAKEQAG
jgi:hypothetical protein